MEKIREKINEVADLCEEQGIPFLAVFGIDKLGVVENSPEGTPEIMRKARSVLFNSTSRARREMEIQA